MELTFEELLNVIGSVHAKFKGGGYSDLIQFNQYTKTIKNGNVVLMKNGKIIPQIINVCGQNFNITEDMKISNDFKGNVLEHIENLYHQYKYSIAEPYDKYARSNFRAIKLDELSRNQFNNGNSRQQARIQLEAFVMLHKIPWHDESKYYWQSEKDKSLIIYKEWRDGYESSNLS